MDNSPLTSHWLGVTLHSIGDAVTATDAGARVTFMNPAAEALTGWAGAEATGTPLATVFQIVDMDTRLQVESPVAKALRDGIVVGLANHTLLIACDGTERPIDDSAAPIRDEAGEVAGVVLVKNLVELHRGSVEAHSDGIGHGSEFVVRLPLASTSAPAPEPALPAAEAAAAGPLRVLVVDDNEEAARMTGMLLRSWGHEVRVAHDGAAALDRSVGFLPKVVLLDIGLPDMDGYEVARHIRRNPSQEGVQLVAAIGYGQDSDRARSEAGFDVHLVKPVEVSDLRDLLAGIHPVEA